MTHHPRRRRHRRRRQAGRRRRPPERRAGAGPTVVGGLAAAGYRISTSGATERQGIVQPTRRRHLGTHGRGQERVRLLPAQAGVPQPHGRQDVPRARPGPARPRRRHRRRAHRAAPRPRLQVRGDEERQAVGHALRGHRGVPARQPARHPPRDRAAPTRSACTSRRCTTPAVGDLTYGADPKLAARLEARPAVAARRRARASSTPARASTSTSRAATRRTSSALSTSSRRSETCTFDLRVKPGGVCRPARLVGPVCGGRPGPVTPGPDTPRSVRAEA